MTRLSRRRLLQTGVAASTAFGLFTISGTKASGQVIGANEAVRVAVCGINGRGATHISELAELTKSGKDNVRFAYLVDPDSRLFESRTKTINDSLGQTPQCVQDVRKALEDPELNAVTVATPNHWHSLISIWACQAGKDVYVEKPLSHNIFEGRKLAEAAKKYSRIVQHGTQSRSSTWKARDIAAVQSGKYGKLLVSKGYCCKPRWSIDFRKPEKAPEGLDWDIWLGPAAYQEYHGNLVHYNWHWFWETGNGDTGNQGVHELDIARWAIKGATHPKSVWSLGGRFAYEDQGQTPNTQLAVFDYGEALVVFETRGLVGKFDIPGKVTNEYYTTDGVIRDGKFFAKGSEQGEPVKVDSELPVAPGGAFGSFIAAVRSRDMKSVNCDAEVGHYSSALCHLANISYRLGEKAPYNAAAKKIGDNKEVVQAFENIAENLKAVGVKLEETDYTVGPLLTFDAKTEKFTGERAEKANQLLTRKYRAPYVVPETV
jgi:predicted dehydrogenase